MKKIQYLFLDIDGTIASDIAHQIPESAIKAFKMARKKGNND